MRLKFEKNINELDKHVFRLKNAFSRIKKKYKIPIDKKDIEKIVNDDDEIAIIDQIVYRFSKLQDTLGKTIRFFLNLKGENVENLSMIDVVNLAEKVGINITEEKWFELRELRNIITHEYEDEYEEIAKTLNKIYNELDYLSLIVNQLKENV